MSRRHSHGARPRFRSARASLATIAFASAFLMVEAAEAVRLYATYSNQDQTYHGPIMLPPDAATTLYLWLEGGGVASTSTPCLAGATGDEICGFSFELSASSTFVMSNYQPDPGFDTSGTSGLPPSTLGPDPENPGNQRLASNAFDLGTPPATNRYLGSVLVTSSASISGEDTIASGGQVVNAGLGVTPIVDRSIVVPEPTCALPMGAGALLVGARRARVWRRARFD